MSQTIKSINNLIKKIDLHFLNDPSGQKFNAVMNILKKYKSSDYKKYINNTKNIYNRQLIHRNDNYDMYLITWGINSKSKIHNHSNNGCCLKLLDGKLEENIYDSNLSLKETNLFNSDSISFMSNSIGYHDIKNIDKNNASISLHIYSPPNHKTIFYDKNIEK